MKSFTFGVKVISGNSLFWKRDTQLFKLPMSHECKVFRLIFIILTWQFYIYRTLSDNFCRNWLAKNKNKTKNTLTCRTLVYLLMWGDPLPSPRVGAVMNGAAWIPAPRSERLWKQAPGLPSPAPWVHTCCSSAGPLSRCPGHYACMTARKTRLF